MSERADVTFESRDVTCAGYLYLPDPMTGTVPCVVMAHGFSGTRNLGLTAYAERFAAAGMAVLVFDYAYFGASGGQPRQLLDLGHQLDDYRAAVAFARAHPRIDPARIALWGTSLSGGHVIVVAAGDPRIAAVVSQVPFPGVQFGRASERSAKVTLQLLAAAVADSVRGRRHRAASPALTADMASRAPKAEVRRYPIGHFDAYTGQWLEKLATHQIAFLHAHLAIKTVPDPGSTGPLVPCRVARWPRRRGSAALPGPVRGL